MDSYGAPQAPVYQPGSNNDFGYTGSGYYANFYNDLEFTMKIGQAAIIAFIILVAVVVCFLLLLCCMYCPTLFGGGYRGQPQPESGGYYPTNIQGMCKYIDVWVVVNIALVESKSNMLKRKTVYS